MKEFDSRYDVERDLPELSHEVFSVEEEFKAFRELSEARANFQSAVLENDSCLAQIVSAFDQSHMNVRRLTRTFETDAEFSRASKRKELLVTELKKVIEPIRNLLKENAQDYEKLNVAGISEKERTELHKSLTARAEELGAFSSRLRLREEFILGTLFSKLKEQAEQIKSSKLDNNPAGERLVRKICSHMHQEPDEFLSSFAKLEQLRDDYCFKRDDIINHNVRLVYSLVLKKQARGSTGDFVQQGMLGLMRAVEKYDLAYNVRFGTFAFTHIKMAIDRTILKNKNIPVCCASSLRKLYKARSAFLKENGCYPTAQELAESLGIKTQYVEELMHRGKFFYSTMSLDKKIDKTGVETFSLADTISSPDVTDEIVMSAEIRKKVHALIAGAFEQLKEASLKKNADIKKQASRQDKRKYFDVERNLEILRYRFGFDDSEFHPLVDVATKFGITRERVRQICNHCQKYLKEYLPADQDIAKLLDGE